MTIRFVPLPPEHVSEASAHWLPFVHRICESDGSDPCIAIANVMRGDVHIAMAWDDDGKRALALVGIEFLQRGTTRVARLIWMSGRNLRTWTGLLPDLENYLTTHQRCDVIEPVARLGWSKILKAAGYRASHVIMQKDFA